MDERARRLALNEAFFRDVNERINQAATTWSDTDVYEYLCECSNADCDFRVSLSIKEYEHVRSDSVWFAVKPHHDLPEIEDVVERHDSHWIVRKRGETGEFVALLDRRDTDA